jgi:hypothetical protein
VKWQGVRPPGSVTIMARADNGENPSAERLADGSYQFTLLESANYTISAWEDLTPRRPTAARRKGADSALPARIDADPVSVAGADKDRKTITMTFVSPISGKPGK